MSEVEGLYLPTYLFPDVHPAVCARCFAVVFDRDGHDMWHDGRAAAA